MRHSITRLENNQAVEEGENTFDLVKQMRLDYLVENKPWIYQEMKDNKTLEEHLTMIEEQYRSRRDELMEQMEADFRTKDGKRLMDLSHMERAGVYQTIFFQAREIAQQEILFR